MNWLEVSLRLQAELAEPAAELLGRLAPNGVAIEPEDALGRRVLVRAWFPADGLLSDRRRKLKEGLWHLGQIQAFPAPVISEVVDQDWTEAWKRDYRPLTIGRRLMVLPTWSTADPGERLAIYLEPGMAFGTGAHPTTRHCLVAIEQHLRPGQSVIDLGCGSGILAIAAARLGASRVSAFDVDPLAIELARLNVRHNGLVGTVDVSLGSIPPHETDTLEPVELLIANIHADTHIQLLQAGLADWVRPGGRILLSGLLTTDLPSLEAAARAARLRLVETLATDDWRSLLFDAPERAGP